ncbi:LpxI family protein [Roseobacter sinensis]|uniref:UDP-2,3-diacylglucosamine diphosphatase LpxI n=1 Tax=Roseobacter sinensis TaxID=2931391 RepID=A0ABT3BC27_9RHOB|nr:UDP-2,3-diacylglucosamine diphosphatase LpxI [Roseobacter sp. WL0113]MCV3270969.1 UDP-2,3-diacylglucosamine diphosphatase LpxI [Roseobacter sp. WL0113]
MLALVAGRGGLPARIAQSVPDAPLVCVLEGFEPDGLAADLTFRLEQIGSLLADLKARGVTEVCFCGGIERPPVDPSEIDAATLPLVPTLMKAIASGDDGALSAVIGVFEQAGLTVRAAHELVPDLLVREGVLSAAQPDDQMTSDMARGSEVLAALAPLDVGQGCVVGAGQIWGIETLGGTDHMLKTLPDAVTQARAVLVKGPKRGQDLRVDMPTIGPETVAGLAAAGLAGLVVEAGGVILLEPEATVAAADAAGLVLWARAPD